MDMQVIITNHPIMDLDRNILTQSILAVPVSFPERIAHDFGYAFALCMYTEEESLTRLPDLMRKC